MIRYKVRSCSAEYSRAFVNLLVKARFLIWRGCQSKRSLPNCVRRPVVYVMSSLCLTSINRASQRQLFVYASPSIHIACFSTRLDILHPAVFCDCLSSLMLLQVFGVFPEWQIPWHAAHQSTRSGMSESSDGWRLRMRLHTHSLSTVSGTAWRRYNWLQIDDDKDVRLRCIGRQHCFRRESIMVF